MTSSVLKRFVEYLCSKMFQKGKKRIMGRKHKLEHYRFNKEKKSVQSLTHVQHFMTPWTAACKTSLSNINSQSLLKLMSIKLVMPTKHLILCHPLFLLPSIFPSFRVFSNELVLPIRWPKYWSFSLSISPSNGYSGLISFSIDWYDLLSAQRTLQEPFLAPQLKSINSLVPSSLFGPTHTSIHAATAAAKSLQSCLTMVRPHRQQPTRLRHPWDSPGKNPGVGCHFPLQCMKVKSESEVALSHPTLSDSMDCSPPGSSVHGIFQAKVLEWVAIAFSNPYMTTGKTIALTRWTFVGKVISLIFNILSRLVIAHGCSHHLQWFWSPRK